MAEPVIASVKRITRDAWPLKPSRALAAVALSVLPPLLQLAVFAGLLHALSRLTQGDDMLTQHALWPMSPHAQLALIAGLAVAGLTLAAAAAYALERIAELSAMRYVRHCTARVFSIVDTRGLTALGGPDDAARRERFNRLLRVDAFNLGRQWHRILALPLPLLGAGLLAIPAIWLEPTVCAALLPILLLAGLAQSRLLTRSAQLSATLEQTAPVANRAQGRAFDTLRARRPIDAAEAMAAFEPHLDTQRRTFLLQAQSHVISQLATALALGALIVVVLIEGRFDAARMTELALAVLMLRIAAGHLSHLASSVTMIARFGPQTRRYFALIDGREIGDGASDESFGEEG
jgi:hypothetical protein